MNRPTQRQGDLPCHRPTRAQGDLQTGFTSFNAAEFHQQLLKQTQQRNAELLEVAAALSESEPDSGGRSGEDGELSREEPNNDDDEQKRKNDGAPRRHNFNSSNVINTSKRKNDSFPEVKSKKKHKKKHSHTSKGRRGDEDYETVKEGKESARHGASGVPTTETTTTTTTAAVPKASSLHEDAMQPQRDVTLAKTKAFNERLRQHPEDLALWLAYISFQQESIEDGSGECIHHDRPHGGDTTGERREKKKKKKHGRSARVVRAVGEKQMAIAEAALQHHPRSESLFLAYLQAASKIYTPEDMETQWNTILFHRCPGRARLWKEYLATRSASRFPHFKATEVARAHCRALHALVVEKERVITDPLVNRGRNVDDIEVAIADMALQAIQCVLDSGYSELGITIIRALLELNWFGPQHGKDDEWPDDALLAMFEQFYCCCSNSSEDGEIMLVGVNRGKEYHRGWWASWMTDYFESETKENHRSNRKEMNASFNIDTEKKNNGLNTDDSRGGKRESVGTWVEVPSSVSLKTHATKIDDRYNNDEHCKGDDEEEEEEVDDEEVQEQLNQLEREIDAALDEAERAIDPETLSIWLDMERERDAVQWNAVSKKKSTSATTTTTTTTGCVGLEYDEVQWKDVRPYLVIVRTPTAGSVLFTGLFRLLGVDLGSYNFGDGIERAMKAFHHPSTMVAAWWMTHPSRQAFVARCLRQCLLHFGASYDPTHWRLADRHPHFNNSSNLLCVLALKLLEITSYTVTSAETDKRTSSSCWNWDAGRAEAKSLLAVIKHHNVDGEENYFSHAVWAALGMIETRAGRYKSARKIYTMSLEQISISMTMAMKKEKNNKKEKNEIMHSNNNYYNDMILGEHAVVVHLLALGLCCLELQTVASSPLSASSKSSNPTTFHHHNHHHIYNLVFQVRGKKVVEEACRPLLWLGCWYSGNQLVFSDIHLENAASRRDALIISAKRGFQTALTSGLQQSSTPPPSARSMETLVLANALTHLLTPLMSLNEENDDVTRRKDNICRSGIQSAIALYKQVLEVCTNTNCSTTSATTAMMITREALEQDYCALMVFASLYAVESSPGNGISISIEAARTLVLSTLLAQHRPHPSPSSARQLINLLRHLLDDASFRRDLHYLIEKKSINVSFDVLIELFRISENHGEEVEIMVETMNTMYKNSRLPLLWRHYLKFVSTKSKDHEILSAVFLRALEACPGSKALWMDGLALLNGEAPKRELSQFLSIMRQKEVAVRTDVLEAVLTRFSDY